MSPSVSAVDTPAERVASEVPASTPANVSANVSAEELDQLLDALTQANDRQLRLYELGRLNVEVFDANATIDRLLTMALKLTDSESALVADLSGETVRQRSVVERVNRSVAMSARAGTATEGRRAGERTEGRRAGTTTPRCVAQSVDNHHSMHMLVSAGDEQYVFEVTRSTAAYGTPDQKMFEAIATALGSSLRLIALHDQSLANAMVEKEHAMAASIVASALPQQIPTFGELETIASTHSARVVGGDFYVAVATDHGLRFVVGDVAGKGLPAAVLMSNAVTVSNLVLHRKSDDDPVMFLEKICEAMDPMLASSGRFITMVVGTLTASADGYNLRLANAGHAPVSVIRRDGSLESTLTSVPPLTPPVGVIPMRSGLQPFTSPFGPGSVLFVGSDGLADQEDTNGAHFGMSRLEELALEVATAADIHHGVFAALEAHAQGTPRSDDQTLFVISSPFPGSFEGGAL